MPPVIQVTNLSKRYRLGQIGGGTLYGDLNRWWAKVRGAPDPALKIGQGDHGQRDGEYIWALKDVSFEVDQGEVLGIIGKNGAGKSTLLKILSRITAPTSGEVRLKGRVGSLLEVGTGFHPELTGRENIYLNGAILGMSTQEVARKFDEIVDFSGVEQFIDTPVKRYSSGMYVRLAFAVAAHLDPEILVVDEVLAVGDAEFQKKCLGKMDDVAREEGRTVLFVSHNMGAIQSLCLKSIVLNNGGISFRGDVFDAVVYYLDLSKQTESNSLKERLDRRGNGKVRFTDAYIQDNYGNKSYQAIIQDQIVITLDLYNFTHPLRRVNTLMTIYDKANYPISHLSNHLTGDRIDLDQGYNQLVCEINNLYLRPGNYSVNLAIISDGVLLDHIENAFTFSLEDNDFFGTGKTLQSHAAPLLARHRWKSYNNIDTQNLSVTN